MTRPRPVFVGLLAAAALIAGYTAVQPSLERARDRRIEELSAKAFAPYQAFYDLTHEVRSVARCQDPEVIRSLVPKALDLQRRAGSFKLDWNYGNAIHYSNLALGRAAFVDGLREDAGRYLLLAGGTPGSPQLDDYGPDMTLALELLECGDRDVVLRYIELCERFWYNRGQCPLKGWAQTVRNRGIPDFGERAGQPLRSQS
jgi:hypothetical protein